MRWRAAWPLVLTLALPARAAASMSGVETLVASGPGNQTEPAIAYPYIAYADFGTGTSRVWYFNANGSDGATTCMNDGAGTCKAVGGEAGSQAFPAVVAGVIAFAQGDGAAARIFRYEIPTGLASPVATSPGPQGNACISQRVVAWEDGPFGATTIWVKDVVGVVNDGKPFAISGPSSQVKPRCSGPLVVYVDVAKGRSIQVFDLDTRATVKVHGGPAASADVDQGVVALSFSTPADPGDIAVVSTSGAPLNDLPLPGLQANPHVSGDWVAFEDWSTGTSRVILWNWKLGGAELYAPPAGNSSQQLNDLDWPRVVYADNRNGNNDVFMYETVFVPPPPPDGGTDGGSDGGSDGGVDGGVDGGADGGVDGGVDGGTDGGVDGGADGGVDGGADGGVDGGTDGGPDGGPLPASCDDADATVLAELVVDRARKEPDAKNVEFRVPRETHVLVCIDPDRVSSAWVLLDDEAIATPRDFNPHVTHLERRREVEEGMNRVGALIAGKPGSSIRVRILLDPRGECDDEHEADEARRHHTEWEKPPRHHEELRAAAEVPPGSTQGCGTTGAGLLGLPALAWLGRRRRGAPGPR